MGLTVSDKKIDLKKIDSIPILNNVIKGKLVSEIFADFEKFRKMNRLYYNIVEEKWGKPNATFRSEFYFKVWLVEFKGYEFLLFCSAPTAGAGSSIEVINTQFGFEYPADLIEICLHLYDEIYKIFKDS